MPKYWHLSIIEASDAPDPAPECGVNCALLVGKRLILEHVGGENGVCEWVGIDGDCLYGELRREGEWWVLRVYDVEDCLIAQLRKPVNAFDCCGVNTDWEQVDGSCDLTVRLEPDPCTCCPSPEPPSCPPDGRPYCTSTDCCPSGQCFLWAQVDTDDAECPENDPNCTIPPELLCSPIRGAYKFSWEDNCLWVARGFRPGGSVGGAGPWPPITHYAELRLSGRTWTLTVLGNNGQVAVFSYTAPTCEWGVEADAEPREMTWVSGTCTEAISARGASLYYQTP
jgi:hypothetical protein